MTVMAHPFPAQLVPKKVVLMSSAECRDFEDSCLEHAFPRGVLGVWTIHMGSTRAQLVSGEEEE